MPLDGCAGREVEDRSPHRLWPSEALPAEAEQAARAGSFERDLNDPFAARYSPGFREIFAAPQSYSWAATCCSRGRTPRTAH